MHRILIALLAASLLSLSGCEDDGPDYGTTDADNDADTDTDTDTDIDTDTDTDTDTDSDTGSDTGEELCDELEFEIDHTPVSLMILQDVSGSMFPSNWNEVLPAINNVINLWTGSQIQWGLDFFPDGSDEDFTGWNCGYTNAVRMDCGSGTEAAILADLNSFSNPNGLTPLACGYYNFTNPSYAPGCLASDVESYVLVVSDGADTCSSCGGYGGSPTDLGNLSAALLAAGVKTFVVGFNYYGDELNAIAANGGLPAPYDEYIPASDQTAFEDALNEIAGAVVNCIYDINITNDVNYDEVNFFFVYEDSSEEVIPYDEDCADGSGWHWVDEATHTQIEFCEDPCDQLQGGEVTDIRGEFGCPQVIVD